jgi:heme exporter protein D
MSAAQHLLAMSGDVAAIFGMSGATAFFRMGGYAAYVWPAYAVFFAVLIADSVAPRLRRRRVLRELRTRLARAQARGQRPSSPTPSLSP